jgi:Flp pilus assembly protein TadG
MNTILHDNNGRRNPERGAIAIVVAALWMTLFGLAAFAVDVGYQYTTRRSLQTAADAAVMAGMPSLRMDPRTAESKARDMAQANGFTTGVTATASGTDLQVNIQATLPTFFLKVFGVTTKSVTARATGRLNPDNPVLFANSTLCPGLDNITLNGGANSTITGDVHSNGGLFYRTGSPFTTTGSATFSCPKNALTYDENPGVVWGQGFAPTGSAMTRSMPFSYTIATDFPNAVCTFGTTSGTGSMDLGSSPSYWQSGGPAGPGTLVPGVYCAGTGGITMGTTNTTGNVTFVSTGRIQLNGTNATLTAYRNGLVAFSTFTGTCALQSIQVGNSGWNITGSFFAPNGCVMNNAGTYQQTGSTVANEISMSMGSGWQLRSTGSGSGAGWHLYQ